MSSLADPIETVATVFDGFTSIQVAADAIAQRDWPADPDSRERRVISRQRESTGVRVTIRFRRRSPLVTGGRVRVCYDFAGNGDRREMFGAPQLTHVSCNDGVASHHYQLSQWIPAGAVMNFIAPLPLPLPYVRLRTEARAMLAHSDRSGESAAMQSIRRHQQVES